MTPRGPRLAQTLFSGLYLNLLWVTASLPILTLPAATGALVVSMHRWHVFGEGPSAQSFLGRMRAVGWRSSLVGAATVGVAALAGANLLIANQFEAGRRVYLALLIAVLVNALVLTVFTLANLAANDTDVGSGVTLSARMVARAPALGAAAGATVIATAVLVAVVPLTLLGGAGAGAAATVETLRHRAAARLWNPEPPVVTTSRKRTL